VRVRVDASTLTQAIQLSAPPDPPIPDGEGGYDDTPIPLTPPGDWAAIEPATSTDQELPIAGAVAGSLTHAVTIRYRPDMNLSVQITFVDLRHVTRRLWVRSIQDPFEQHELLKLWCEERVTA